MDKIIQEYLSALKETKQISHSQDVRNDKESLFTRFSEQYKELSALPRNVRRAIKKKCKYSLAGIAILIALGGLPASAAVINVTAGAVDNIENQNCSIVEAILAANRNQEVDSCGMGDDEGDGNTINSGDFIVLPDNSTFTFNSPYIPIGQIEGNSALPDITSEITIEGNGSTIERDENSTAEFRIIEIDNNNMGLILVEINDTTFTNGNVTGNRSGGAIYNDDAGLTINNCTITNNTASRDGGGVDSDHSQGGFLNVFNSNISGNEAQVDGGGINISGGTATINNSTISGNKTITFGGGGIFVEDGFNVRISNSTISNNQSLMDSNGGGIYNFSGSDPSTIIISNSTISNNIATFSGGGIYNYTNGVNIAEIRLFHTTITGNIASIEGGGISNIGFGPFGNIDARIARLDINNSIISGNSTTNGAGDEIFNNDLNGSDISSNTFNIFGHVGINNSQAFSGLPTNLSFIDATSDGNNTPLQCIRDSMDTCIIETDLINNGGPTRTHFLGSASIARDAVTDSTECQFLDMDQTGFMRDSFCDIGSVEFRVIPLPTGFEMCAMSELCGDGVDNDGNGFIDDEETCI